MKGSQRKRYNEALSQLTSTREEAVEDMQRWGIDSNRIMRPEFVKYRKRNTKMLSEELHDRNKKKAMRRKRNGERTCKHSQKKTLSA